MQGLAVAYAEDALYNKAQALALQLNLPVDNTAPQQILVTTDQLMLKIRPFSAMAPDFSWRYWQKRHDEGKKQGLVRACRPRLGLTILDATAGWGRDAAVLASFGAQVILLERNPIMALLLADALEQRDLYSKQRLALQLIVQDSNQYLEALAEKNYPDVIYIDPMHPPRQKSALVKKDLQILQKLVSPDDEVAALIQLAKLRIKDRVVVKWPQGLKPLLKPVGSIEGKTIRFDIY